MEAIGQCCGEGMTMMKKPVNVSDAARDYYQLCRSAAIVNNHQPSSFASFARKMSGIHAEGLDVESDDGEPNERIKAELV